MTSNTADISLWLANAFEAACMDELEALKPGNVHIFADGHGMAVQDFMRSAEAAAAVIAQPELSVGQRILSAIEATRDAVGCNTNLGIVLLCAPLIQAMLRGDKPTLREGLQQVLHGLTVADAELAYQAIVLASPAGLGASDLHDVHTAPCVTLLQAMQHAQQRDRIALQYASGFSDVFDIGVPIYTEALLRWQRPAWAATAVYLGFLARFDDSHVLRKLGVAMAVTVRQEAAIHEQALLQLDNPKTYQRELLRFDAELKARGLNPGTSADLTVATLFAVSLQDRP